MDIVERLNGVYRTPITDGLGPAGGEEPDNPNEFVRTFLTPPIQKEAAATITALRKRVEELEGAASTHQRALEALEEAREALLVFAAFSDKAERFVEHKAKFGGTAIFPVKDFRLSHFRRAVEVVALIDTLWPGDAP